MIKSEPKPSKQKYDPPKLLYNGKKHGEGMVIVFYFVTIDPYLIVLYSEDSQIKTGQYYIKPATEENWQIYHGSLLISNE